MNYENPTFCPLGEQHILITWETIIEEELLEFLLKTKKRIIEKNPKGKIEVINTYNSILVGYSVCIEDIYTEIKALKSIVAGSGDGQEIKKNYFSIPVCYEEQFGLDLHALSEKKELAIAEIIELHTKPVYTVYFIGFLPGFLYLGGLPEKLHFPRKKTPRLKVGKGAVGIGGKQTGIYPQDSAGGWQLLGSCPLNLFDVSLENPSPFEPGDKLSFRSVSKEEYEAIEAQVKKGTYQFQKEVYGS